MYNHSPLLINRSFMSIRGLRYTIIRVIMLALIVGASSTLTHAYQIQEPLWLQTGNIIDESISAPSAPPSALQSKYDWRIQKDDYLVVNLTQNTMTLNRADGSRTSSPLQVGSGLNQDAPIRWIGKTYNPRTPAAEWIIKAKKQQSQRWVFGTNEKDENGNQITEQLFLRLYRMNDNGEPQYSNYGIHTTPNIESIYANSNGYGSYGCILTDYNLLKFLEEMLDYQQEAGEEGIRISTYWER